MVSPETKVLSPGKGERTSPFAEPQGTYQPGNSTVSITWMTPFDCITLRMVT